MRPKTAGEDKGNQEQRGTQTRRKWNTKTRQRVRNKERGKTENFKHMLFWGQSGISKAPCLGLKSPCSNHLEDSKGFNITHKSLLLSQPLLLLDRNLKTSPFCITRLIIKVTIWATKDAIQLSIWATKNYNLNGITVSFRTDKSKPNNRQRFTLTMACLQLDLFPLSCLTSNPHLMLCQEIAILVSTFSHPCVPHIKNQGQPKCAQRDRHTPKDKKTDNWLQ